MDLTPQAIGELAKIAQSSEKSTHRAAIDLHVSTFECPTCPNFIKTTECVSDGKYCAYYPKMGDLEITELDPEDYKNPYADTMTGFNGRE